MKLVTIVGARPQFIKTVPVSRSIALRSETVPMEEVLLHTGQHYDPNMSDIFFQQLGILEPKYNLGIGAGTHGEQTGRMLIGLEQILLAEKPDCVLIYGDTNSTLSAALAAAKQHLPVAHVEAGLRSFNRNMPEEINRVLADHLSTLLFAPTQTATRNLEKEGILDGVHLVGDVMQDAIAEFAGVAEQHSTILSDLKLRSGEYLFVTLHRAENTDDPSRLGSILQALRVLAKERAIVWPVHPRTKKLLDASGESLSGVRMIDPVSYLDALAMLAHSRVILTDSGGIQKEARWLHVPCVTLRNETEWVETLEGGWNRLAGSNTDAILGGVEQAAKLKASVREPLAGSGASQRIVEILARTFAA